MTGFKKDGWTQGTRSFLLFEQGALNFHFIQGTTNYIALFVGENNEVSIHLEKQKQKEKQKMKKRSTDSFKVPGPSCFWNLGTGAVASVRDTSILISPHVFKKFWISKILGNFIFGFLFCECYWSNRVSSKIHMLKFSFQISQNVNFFGNWVITDIII